MFKTISLLVVCCLLLTSCSTIFTKSVAKPTLELESPLPLELYAEKFTFVDCMPGFVCLSTSDAEFLILTLEEIEVWIASDSLVLESYRAYYETK